MLQTARSLLGALILKPELIQSLGDVDATGLFTPNEAVVFRAISDIWEDGHPKEINSAILADRIAGKVNDPATFVGSLLDGLISSSATPEGIRACLRELRQRHLGVKILREFERLKDTFSGKGEPDEEGVDQLCGYIIEREGLKRASFEDADPNLVWLNTVQPELVTWLWPGRLLIGKITLLSGDPGTGKSFLSLDLAARITTGRPGPDDKPLKAGACLFLVGEDGLGDTVRARADMLKADPSKIAVLDGVKGKDGQPRFFRFDEHMTVLENAANLIPDLRLIVIDPIASFLGKFDPNKQGDARAVMDPLAKIAERRCVSVLVLAHLNKAQTASAVYRTSGSQQWSAAPRAVFYLAEDPEDRDRRILYNLKMSLAKKPHKLSFVISDKGPTDYRVHEDDYRSADDILQAPNNGAGGARQRASLWLKGVLKAGPMKADDVAQARIEANISDSTLQRAKRELGIDSYMDGNTFPKQWYWILPK